MSAFRNITTKLLAQIPVVGPHDDIEGELLLLGKKPLGWIRYFPENDLYFEPPLPPKIAAALDLQRRLDQAVHEGRLKFIDVATRDYEAGGLIAKDVQEFFERQKQVACHPRAIAHMESVAKSLKYDRDGRPYREYIYRHYCQPQFEEDLKLAAAYNQAAFNRRPLPFDLSKDWGAYLGYRRRDQLLWSMLHSRNTIVRRIARGVDKANNHAQPAYQSVVLKRPRKAKPRGEILKNDSTI